MSEEFDGSTTWNISSSEKLTMDDVRRGIEAIKKVACQPRLVKFESCKKHVKMIKDTIHSSVQHGDFSLAPLSGIPVFTKPYLKTIHAHYSNGVVEKIRVRKKK